MRCSAQYLPVCQNTTAAKCKRPTSTTQLHNSLTTVTCKRGGMFGMKDPLCPSYAHTYSSLLPYISPSHRLHTMETLILVVTIFNLVPLRNVVWSTFLIMNICKQSLSYFWPQFSASLKMGLGESASLVKPSVPSIPTAVSITDLRIHVVFSFLPTLLFCFI